GGDRPPSCCASCLRKFDLKFTTLDDDKEDDTDATVTLSGVGQWKSPAGVRYPDGSVATGSIASMATPVELCDGHVKICVAPHDPSNRGFSDVWRFNFELIGRTADGTAAFFFRRNNVQLGPSPRGHPQMTCVDWEITPPLDLLWSSTDVNGLPRNPHWRWYD